MSNVLFVKGTSQYNAMRNYIEEIEMGFRIAGYNTYIIDTKENSVLFQIDELIQKIEIHLIFTCNALNIEILRDKFPNIYYATYLCDHPVFQFMRLSRLDEKCIVFTCDQHHEEYIKKYCSNIGYVKFMPVSGSCSKKYIPYKERTRDIVFTGTYVKPEKRYEELLEFDGIQREIAENMAKRMIMNPEEDIEVCLENILKDLNVKLSESEFHALAYNFDCVDKYAGYYYRDKMIRSLVESDLKVHVFGNGWEEFEGKGKENLIIEKGNFYVAQKAVADAKIAMNIMPWFKAGFQERIAAAMLSGTVAVTDESNYILNRFTDGEDLVLYSLKELEELPKKIKWLLKSPNGEAEKIAQNGMKQAECSMTWQHRTNEMIQYIQECFKVFPAQKEECGEVLQIAYETVSSRSMALDIVNHMKEIIEMIQQVQLYDKIELCDIDYFYSKFLFQFLRIRTSFPELDFKETVYDYLVNLTDEQIPIGVELLLGECTRVLSVFLDIERKELYKDMQRMQLNLKQLRKLLN